MDVRDPSEVEAGKGGPPAKIPGAVNVPLNMDGVKQRAPTTQDEFLDNIKKAIDALPKDRPDHHAMRSRAEHCCDAGFEAYNGGDPRTSVGARVAMTEVGGARPYTPCLMPWASHTDPASLVAFAPTASLPSSPASSCFESAFFTSNSRKL